MSEPDLWASKLAVVCEDCGESLGRCACRDLLGLAELTAYEADAFLTVYSTAHRTADG